jgi:hypothetical protein
MTEDDYMYEWHHCTYSSTPNGRFRGYMDENRCIRGFDADYQLATDNSGVGHDRLADEHYLEERLI